MILIKNFEKKGYVKINNVFSKREIKKVNVAMYDSLLTFINDKSKSKVTKKFTMNKFQKLMNYAYYKRKKIFQKLYDFAQNQITLYELCSNQKLLKLISKILKVKQSSLIVGDLTLRIDNPGISSAALDYHQESTYYPEVKNYSKSILIWIPLHEIKKNGGGLSVCSKFFSKKYKTKWDGRQAIVDPKMLKRLSNDYTFVGKEGSILACNFNLFHASSINKSSEFRFSCAFRFFSSEAKKFFPFRKFRRNQLAKV